MIKFCKNCVIPSSKPNIRFIDGICTSCYFHLNEKKKKIDWNFRKKEFDNLISKIKKKKNQGFDVLVPVSGGKDSITQVHYMLKAGLRVLALNVDYGFKTDIGEYNLNLIPKMGANLFTFRPNMKLHRRVLKISFEEYGDPDLMSHCLLHALPIKTAIKFNIPLVFLGENSAYEYSGDKTYDEKKMSYKWFENYAANNGMTPNKFSKKHNISFDLMDIYNLPNKNELNKTNAVFTSYFFKWDSEINLKIAKKYGFKTLNKNGEGTYRNYVGIDEKINRIHQYLKYLKFGYGRATDHACEDIRNGRINRHKAIRLVKKFDRVPVTKYYYKEFINMIGASEKKFFSTLKKYTNKKLFNINGKNFLFKFKNFN